MESNSNRTSTFSINQSNLSSYHSRRHFTEPQPQYPSLQVFSLVIPFIVFSFSFQAKRKAIAMQMYDTEKSYVEALKNLVTVREISLELSNQWINLEILFTNER